VENAVILNKVTKDSCATQQSETYAFLVHVNDKSTSMESTNTEELNFFGAVDLLRCL
jgi:hypothetical protein